MAAFQNAERGLKIKGSNFSYMIEGAYGIVFVDREQGRIAAAFVEQPSRHPVLSLLSFRSDAIEQDAIGDRLQP